MTLEQLSAAATEGEWTVELDTRTELCRATGDELSYTAGYDISGTSQVVGCEGILGGPEGEANAAFIVALVNAYRTGQLVAVQPDDATVEQIVKAGLSVATIGTPSEIAVQIAHNTARAAIAAMPSQAALQAEIERLRIELQNIAETTDDDITSRQAFEALSKGPKP